MTRLCAVRLRATSSSLPLPSSEPSRFRFAIRRLACFPRWPIRLTPSPSINVALDTCAGSTWRAAWQQPVYLYPDPIPEFAKAIFKDFLETEYGGPGTLLVEPFTDMFLGLKLNKLPGAAVAARAALLWGQNYLDRNW